METDPTQLGIEGEKHPTLAELKDSSLPHIHSHLESCQMCRAVIAATDLGSAPIAAQSSEGPGQRERLQLAGGSDRARRHGADLRG